MHLPILYQDPDLVIINKPSGLLVHRSLIAKYETEFALQTLRDQLGRIVYPVHRLDRATSGALVFALSQDVARKLGTEFTKGRVEKKYLTIVRGILSQKIHLDYPLKEELDKKSDLGVRADKAPQSAQTVFLPLAQCELPYCVDKYPSARYTLIQALPLTGRKHQIRRHLRHLGHPIIGDITYGVGKHNRFFETNFQIRRLLLACTEISFLHPRSKLNLSVQAPLATDFRDLLIRLNWGGFLD